MLEDKLRLSPVLTIGPQVDEDELTTLAKEGFKTIVNLTGKGEFEQLLSPGEEEEVVKELGMEYLHHPVTLSRVRLRDIDELCQTISGMETPVFVHCRIGQRASLIGLSFHALRRNFTRETILKRAKKMGIRWRAPYLRDLLNKYIERARPMREELLETA